MTIRTITSSAELEAYDAWVRGHPAGSLWQSGAWGDYQRALGKEVRIYTNEERKMKSEKYDMTALVIIDRTIGGYATWEIPRGPLMNEERKMKSEKYAEEFVQAIVDDAKKDKCLALYMSPPSLFTLHSSLFTPSPRHIQPQSTRILDLAPSEEEILAQMHPKGRYNIQLARKHGVETCESHVSTTHDIDAFYALLEGTGGRDGFRISQKSHYTRFLSALEGSFLLLAKHEGRPIAGLMGVMWNGTALYYYGASSYEHRSLMAPYLLQWEAIRHAKAKGCTGYDLLGISPENAGPEDPWRGITDFKRKFGGTVLSYPQEQMLVLRPLLTMALDLKRKVVG